MKLTLGRSLAILAIAAIFSSCQSPPPKPRTETTTTESTRNNSYSLLHDLLGDEKDVSKLRFIKREDSDVKKLLNKIAAAARKGYLELEAFAKVDPSLRLNDLDLPPGETKTRKDISATTEHQLLHESGERLELDLLLNQVEALRYASHLAKIAAENDFNTDRSQYLLQLGRQMQSLHDETVAQLSLRNPPGAK
ncbi:MAG TPA: hypothetical protein VG938_01055 [Verrucomicrobiae bacterium]|nr:hypothetical protein [Verrucomicrobiae bacterium]